MQNETIRLDEIFPVTNENGKQKLQMPDRMELVMEDGTVYHVRSFFAEHGQMSEMLDALAIERLNRRA